MKVYGGSVMRDLRERLGVEPNDESRDGEIMSRTPNENFKELCEWNGLLGSICTNIKSWVLDIYGIDLEQVKITKPEVKVEYVSADRLYEVDWAKCSGYNFFPSGWWDGTMLLMSRTLTSSELERIRDAVEVNYLAHGTTWEDQVVDDASVLTYCFELEDKYVVFVNG